MGTLSVENMLFTSLAILLLWYFHYHWKRRHLYRHASKIPGIKGYPVVGNLFDFTGDANEIFDNVTKHFDRCTHIVKAWIGPILVCGITKPLYLEKVLTSPNTNSRIYLFRTVGRNFLGNGLFTAPRPVWKRHRKMINPILNRKILDRFVEVFGTRAVILGERLEEYVGRRNVDLLQIVSRCTLDIAFETIIGVQVNAQDGESEVVEWTDTILETMLHRLYNFWYHHDFIYKRTRLHKETQVLLTKCNQFVAEAIKNKEKSDKSEFPVLLDYLLDLSSSGTEITTDEIVDEIKTFVAAAFDTTAVVTCFVITTLALHPDIQDQVDEEVLRVLGPEKIPDFQDLPSLKYTELVIKETMRLFPPNIFMARDVQEDLPLDENITLPKGSVVMLGVLHVHRSTEYWPDPLKFDPDRFSPERSTNRHPFTYIPFSAGPMNCIGQKYAMMSLKTIVATLIRKFKFRTEYKTVDEVKLRTKVVLRPRDGFKTYFEIRKNQ
ncbi:cytochrome P450 4C1-like [Zophobas morio]|uniref:cytochrome P450 4C1-like n=1 Tax=Zophobas morio TaxID=2755281 RepID=UPI003082AC4E